MPPGFVCLSAICDRLPFFLLPQTLLGPPRKTRLKVRLIVDGSVGSSKLFILGTVVLFQCLRSLPRCWIMANCSNPALVFITRFHHQNAIEYRKKPCFYLMSSFLFPSYWSSFDCHLIFSIEQVLYFFSFFFLIFFFSVIRARQITMKIRSRGRFIATARFPYSI